ncbi:hypothetical protein BHM03_00046372 [Ensete ventricosum]|nr:hypothetical protein BHM03_00046372 [Ensete ventricosum]
MINMSLMRGLPKVGGGRPTSASSMPVNALASEQPTEPTSPPDMQEIPTYEVMSGTYVERTRGTSEVPRKRPTEELTDQRKKTKVSSWHRSHRGGDSRDRSESRTTKGKEPVTPIKETPTAQARPWSMKELCGIRLGKDGRDYHAIRASEQLECASDAPLEVDLAQLAQGGQSGWTTRPRQALADNLKAELEEAIQERELLNKELSGVQGTLSGLRGQLAKAQGCFDDSLGQLADVEEVLADSEGQLRNVDLPKQAVKEYQKSPGFEMGLVRMGRGLLEVWLLACFGPALGSASRCRDRGGSIHTPSRGCRHLDGGGAALR